MVSFSTYSLSDFSHSVLWLSNPPFPLHVLCFFMVWKDHKLFTCFGHSGCVLFLPTVNNMNIFVHFFRGHKASSLLGTHPQVELLSCRISVVGRVPCFIITFVVTYKWSLTVGSPYKPLVLMPTQNLTLTLILGIRKNIVPPLTPLHPPTFT